MMALNKKKMSLLIIFWLTGFLKKIIDNKWVGD